MHLSPCSDAYSRIDIFLTDKWLLQNISASTIHTVTWSDHAPISINLFSKPSHPHTCMWWTNNYLLQDTTNAASLCRHLDNFFSLNSNLVIDPATAWTAHEAIFRGIFIQLGSHAKKKRMQRLDELTTAITASESLNKTNPSPYLQSKIF